MSTRHEDNLSYIRSATYYHLHHVDLMADLERASSITVAWVATLLRERQVLESQLSLRSQSLDQLRTEVHELRRRLSGQAFERVRWIPPLDQSQVRLHIHRERVCYAVPISFTVWGSTSRSGTWEAPENVRITCSGYLLYVPEGWSGPMCLWQIVDRNGRGLTHPHISGGGEYCLGRLQNTVDQTSADAIVAHRDEVARTLSWVNLDSPFNYPEQFVRAGYFQPEQRGWKRVEGGKGVWFTTVQHAQVLVLDECPRCEATDVEALGDGCTECMVQCGGEYCGVIVDRDEAYWCTSCEEWYCYECFDVEYDLCNTCAAGVREEEEVNL